MHPIPTNISIIETPLGSHPETDHQIVEYSEILDGYNLVYSPYEYYWQVGDIQKVQGWIIHLSVLKFQLIELLHVVIPELTAYNVPFKVVRDFEAATFLLNGALGYVNLGKIISIYPTDDQEALALAKKLIPLTKGFRGPAIPTDRLLGSIVNTRYGSFNPIIQADTHGAALKYIYNVKGELDRDPYHIPFRVPPGIIWPFEEIASPEVPKRAKLLNYAYYPVSILKPDAKGDVIRALYFKRLWQIKSCLVKQGRLNMLADYAGRDIQDRLQWQHELYKDLNHDIPMPRVFDFFRENDDCYLAMEFIKGKSINQWISQIYQDQNWSDLPPADQIKIIDQLLTIFKIIKRLHERGYVHRDITPENFLIDKNNKIILIDMELTWSIRTGTPDPPFELGTPGFMSPEQISMSTPTVKEDIYALGAFMLVYFINLPPLKHDPMEAELFQKNLSFFIANIAVVKLICDCLKQNSFERPELTTLTDTLTTYRTQLLEAHQSSNRLQTSFKTPENEMQVIVQLGISGLAHPQQLSKKGRWLSRKKTDENHIGNEQLELDIYEGWHTGLSGPLWLIALAKRAGFDISMCKTAYSQSWDYIENHTFKNPEEAQQGLYSGAAGIAMALIAGLSSGSLPSNSENIERLKICISGATAQFSLSMGIAGQGIAMLQAAPWLDSTLLQNLLKLNVNALVQNQGSDGSWALRRNLGKREHIITGLDDGVAGIIWFLLAYLERYDDRVAKTSVIKGLHWLIMRSRKIHGTYSWNTVPNNKATATWGSSHGTPGITLLFIKAFEVLKDGAYQKIAENNLTALTPRPVRQDYTLTSGLAGIGEIYLEAHRVFGNQAWKSRADWIASVFANTFLMTEERVGLWVTDNSINTSTADLFVGNSGILHFLIRYLSPQKLGHPLSPFVFNNLNHSP